jgi:tripartite-type tricarboxylate transporter receptor subunit TctC
MRGCVSILISALLLSTGIDVTAQGFPNRTIKVVSPQPPGGNIDATARIVAQALSQAIGQQVIVENKPGAGGTVGTAAVAKSPPDGYTLLFAGSGQLAVAGAVYPGLPYDASKDLIVLAPVQQVAMVITAGPGATAATFADALALAKSKPSTVSVGTAGNGSSNHLALALLEQQTSVDFLHIPFKGSGQALQNLLGGQVAYMVDQVNSSLPHIKSGKLKALAVTTKTRVTALPDVPTLDELGIKGYDTATYSAILAPAGTPADVVEKLRAALAKGLNSTEVRDQFANMAVEPMTMSVAQFESMMKTDIVRWKQVAASRAIKAE